MRIVSWEEFTQGILSSTRKSSSAIGVFDGVHIGHQKLIESMHAEGTPETHTLFTFRENPLLILRNKPFIGNLMTYSQKIEAFRGLNINTVVMIDFSTDISKLSGTDFLKIILNNIDLRCLVIGKNFTCGYKADTNAEKIRYFLNKKEINVHVMKPVTYKGTPVSSTRIRKAIVKGNVNEANAMLGKEYCLDIKLEKAAVSRDTVQIQRASLDQVLPESGDFPVDLMNGKKNHRSTVSIRDKYIIWPQPEHFQTEKILFKDTKNKE